MNRAFRLLFTLILITTAQPSFSRIITSIEDASLGGGNTISFDNIPLGFLRDSYTDNTINIDGVTFSQETITDNGLTFPIHSITIDGVHFSNGGSTSYPTNPEDATSPYISIDELALVGEDDYLNGAPNINISENHILVQRPRNIRELSEVSTGPENSIEIRFNTPVTAFGLEFGSNQGSQSIEVYNTVNELIATIPHRNMGIGYEGFTSFYGYSIDSDSEKKLAFLNVAIVIVQTPYGLIM